jgi:hypothetical protein
MTARRNGDPPAIEAQEKTSRYQAEIAIQQTAAMALAGAVSAPREPARAPVDANN